MWGFHSEWARLASSCFINRMSQYLLFVWLLEIHYQRILRRNLWHLIRSHVWTGGKFALHIGCPNDFCASCLFSPIDFFRLNWDFSYMFFYDWFNILKQCKCINTEMECFFSKGLCCFWNQFPFEGVKFTWGDITINLSNYLSSTHFYRPQRSCGLGNIFAPVCHSVHRREVVVSQKTLRQTPPRSGPPQSRHPQDQTPLGADSRADTPPGVDPPGSRLRHTVYERPVRILLECIVVPVLTCPLFLPIKELS